MNYLYRGGVAMLNGISCLYDILIGDLLWHKRWKEREAVFNEMSRGKDLNNLSELQALTYAVEERLGISEVG